MDESKRDNSLYAQIKTLERWHKKRFGYEGDIYSRDMSIVLDGYKQCQAEDKSTQELFGALPDDVLWD